MAFPEGEDPANYVELRVAAARSGLTPEEIKWPCETGCEVTEEPPLIRSAIDADGVFKVHLGDVINWAGMLAEDNRSPKTGLARKKKRP